VYVQGGHYAAWAAFLDRWATGEALDPATLPALEPADFASDSWQRLVDRVTAAISRRLADWSHTLSRELSTAPDEFAAARALNHARWTLVPIRALAGALAMPEDLRTRLVDLVDTQIRSAQKALDDSVDRMRRAGVPRAALEARLRTIRDNPLMAVTERSNAHVTSDAWAGDPLAAPRRRVIVD
jgi:hypothetical protein